MYRFIITGLKEIVQITDRCDVEFLQGSDMGRIKVLSDPKNHLAVLVAMDGTIAAVGKLEEVRKVQNGQPVEGSLNTNGGILLPGFVDGHSHPVFAGDRVHEFAMKLAGATYMEIAHVMLRNGTTTLEAKSGYGLNTESELKMLRVLDRVNDDTPLEISATFCGGHAVPKARAMSHLEEISDEGIQGMAKSGTVAVVLPSTAFILRLTPPPVKKMIENGLLPQKDF
ncbi:hypothetical protein TELCIR_05134 [Teladorsagia circumcincta]|uniref:imidazolonepropionase n=1 Tax=Teladorsagia circumcincta TaxID=45464 RepID=A0A2G9URL2_TELCI|nr:hypothetical protein TELCIR_05134 [Teladorsagia circumcincta]